MKIRRIFEPTDFEGCGQMLVRDNGTDTAGQMSAVAYKVGYYPGASDRDKNWALIALSDGQIKFYPTLEGLCEFLNNDQFGFRPLQDEEIVDITENVGNRFPFGTPNFR